MQQRKGQQRVKQETHQDRRPGDQDGAAPDASPSPAQTRDAVERLLGAGLVAPGSRAHLLLDYLLTIWHREGAVPVKAYAIALDVLGRGADFDPGTDSIVRVELGRLRKLLDLYYAGPGAHDPVRLSLPKGQSRIEAAFRPIIAPPPTETPVPSPRPAKTRRLGLVAGAVALLAGLALWGAAPLVRPAQLVVTPTQVADDDPQLATLAEGLGLHLASDLARFRTFEVVLSPPPRPSLFHRVTYRLDSRLEPAAGVESPQLTLMLIRAADGALIWSQSRPIGAEIGPSGNPGAGIARMLGEVTQRIVGPRGALEADGRARLQEIEAMWLGRPPEDFLCLLRAQAYDHGKDEALRDPARRCLTRLTRARSPVGAIWAAQSAMQLLDWSEDITAPGPERLAVALASAHRAAALDPGGADGPAAMGAALTAMGRLEDAQTALAQAAELGPHDPDIAMRQAWLACLQGDWEAGLTAIAAQTAAREAVPGWYRLPLALDALRRADVLALQDEATRILASGDRRGLILQLAAARLSGNEAAMAETRAAITAAGARPAQLAQAIGRLFPDRDLGARLFTLATAP